MKFISALLCVSGSLLTVLSSSSQGNQALAQGTFSEPLQTIDSSLQNNLRQHQPSLMLLSIALGGGLGLASQKRMNQSHHAGEKADIFQPEFISSEYSSEYSSEHSSEYSSRPYLGSSGNSQMPQDELEKALAQKGLCLFLEDSTNHRSMRQSIPDRLPPEYAQV